MIDVSPAQISWLALALAGAGLSFLGLLAGLFLAGRFKKQRQDPSATSRMRIETQKRLLESAERANQGLQQAMEVLEWAAGDGPPDRGLEPAPLRGGGHRGDGAGAPPERARLPHDDGPG